MAGTMFQPVFWEFGSQTEPGIPCVCTRLYAHLGAVEVFGRGGGEGWFRRRLLKKFFDAGYTEKPTEVAAEIDKLVEATKLSADLRRPFKELAKDLRKAKEIAIISES